MPISTPKPRPPGGWAGAEEKLNGCPLLWLGVSLAASFRCADHHGGQHWRSLACFQRADLGAQLFHLNLKFLFVFERIRLCVPVDPNAPRGGDEKGDER